MGIACSTSRNIACKKSKGRRLRLTLFAWQAAEGMLSVHSSFFFPMFILRCWILATTPTLHVTFPMLLFRVTFQQHPLSPSLSHPSHLRCSQLSRLREEFVRLTFLTARAFSAHFLSILYLYFSTCLPHPVCGIYTFFDARRSIVKSFRRDCNAAMIITMLVRGRPHCSTLLWTSSLS